MRSTGSNALFAFKTMHTEETKKKIAESVRDAHRRSPRTDETKAKISSKVKSAYSRGDKIGFQKGNKCGSLRTPESVKKSVDACIERNTGSGGHGRMHIGRPDHVFALHWVIESPEGERFEFDNLNEWCRKNEWRFDPEPPAKRPLWERASRGMSGKPQWKGWRVIVSAND